MNVKEVLEYEDVSLTQQYSLIDSRNDVDTSSKFSTFIPLQLPVVSAPMATITESEMAIAMAKSGGIGVLHRFMPDQEIEIKKVVAEGYPVVASIGLQDNPIYQAGVFYEAGAAGVVIDVAHGGMLAVKKLVTELKAEIPNLDVIAGNVMTADLAKILENAGADAIRVGIGPGAVCTTRNKTGVGGGQLTAVHECSQAVTVPVIADGGIREYGDVVKALAAGASSVMIGSMFAGCPEVPDIGKRYHRGSAWPLEGEQITVTEQGSVRFILEGIEAALRSGMSYLGVETVEDLPLRAIFRKR